MSLPKPYYTNDLVTIYNCDCLDILPELEPVDLVLTDPPYPNLTGRVSTYQQCSILFLNKITCRQFVFWQATEPFPLDYSSIHIWDKKTGTQSQYERIFERNSESKANRVFRHYLINSTVAAQMTGDFFSGHFSQKPMKLILELLELTGGDITLDPFLGSGTTAVACMQLNRKCIGIEIEEKYAEIAAHRCELVSTGKTRGKKDLKGRTTLI